MPEGKIIGITISPLIEESIDIMKRKTAIQECACDELELIMTDRDYRFPEVETHDLHLAREFGLALVSHPNVLLARGIIELTQEEADAIDEYEESGAASLGPWFLDGNRTVYWLTEE